MYRERDASLTQMSIIDNGHTGKTVEHRLAAERFTRTSFRTDCVQRNRQSGKFPLKIDGKTHEEHKGKSKLTKDMKTPTQHVRLDRLKLIPDAQQFWTWIHWDSHNRLCWTDWLRTKKLICRSDQLNKRSLVRILLWAKACDNFFWFWKLCQNYEASWPWHGDTSDGCFRNARRMTCDASGAILGLKSPSICVIQWFRANAGHGASSQSLPDRTIQHMPRTMMRDSLGGLP